MAITRRSTGSMNEELETRWEIIMDNILQQRNINTARCQIGHNQVVDFLLAELTESLISRLLVHETEDESGFEAGLAAYLMQVLNVMACRAENDTLILLVCLEVYELLHDVEQHGRLLDRLDHIEVTLEVVRKLGLLVYLHHLVVLDARQREVLHAARDGRREEQTLTRLRHALRDLVQLLRETQLKDPIALVINDKLHLRQLQVGFLDAVHESTGRGDDHVWVQQEALELILHVIATSDEHVSQVRVLCDSLEVERRLNGDFTSGTEYDAARTDYLRVLLQFFDGRYDEGTCLTTTCSRHSNDIEALHNLRNCFTLDWRR